MLKKYLTRTIKNIIILSLIFLAILSLLFWLFFSDFKEKTFLSAKNNYELNIDKYTNKLEDKILLFDKISVDEYTSSIKNEKLFNNVKIKYKRFLFNKENLIFQTKSFSDTSWNLADVTIDAKFGEIIKIEETSYFEFIPSPEFNYNESLILKYQLFKNNEIKNFVIAIDLNLLDNKDIERNKGDYLSIFEYFYNVKIDDSIIKEIKFDGNTYATIEYILDEYDLKNDIYEFFIKLLIAVLISFLPIAVLIVFYDKYVENKYIVKPIRYLDKVVSNIVENKFANIENEVLQDNDEYKNLLKNISKLSNKVASLVNELNINRETLERNLLTDNLTGLYDKKMFDIDMKSMFVSSIEGYIFSLKIAKLNQIENLNGTVKTDDFILSYVNIINNVIHSYKNQIISFYRFHGAEFIILARGITYLEAVEFSDKIINNLVSEISKSYKLPNNIFHMGGTPIDKYGTIDSIMNSVTDAYKDAVSKGGNAYEILEESKIKEKVEKTESEVKYIIDENNFNIDFAFDSYSFDNQLLMRELKPILKDQEGNNIPIGSFVAISEKLGLNRRFDEDVILKVLEFTKNNKITYKIAINLSIRTISDINFIEFLYKLIEENKDFKNYILFSITSYSASAYKEEFIKFVDELNQLEIEVLLKRYKTKEYSLEELSELKISYLKIDKDLTQNIHSDLVKKHRMKNIVVFAEVNDTKIIVENVESDKDYAFLSRLDLYAVNR
jgi:EAL domain-containing protein (putative c-di-GMP-specific phosphodiesterase class I)/GGDEF domain-containing protein